MSNDDDFCSNCLDLYCHGCDGKASEGALKSGATWQSGRAKDLSEEAALFLGTVVALGKEIQP